MRVVVTGSGGFIGSHLCKRLNSLGLEVLELMLDITKTEELRSWISAHNFDVFVHLAGMSSVSDCEANHAQAFRVNLESTYEIGALLSSLGKTVHMVFPSTGQVYAAKPFGEEQVYNESDMIGPRNFYGLTKYLAEEALRSLTMRQSFLSVTALRIFNHSHVSQRPDFFLPSVYKQIILGKSEGLSEVAVRVGAVDVCRDIGAIQDLLEALVQVILKGPALPFAMNIFNVSSGRGKNLGRLIDVLAKHLQVTVNCIQNEELVRRNEPRVIVASNDKFMAAYSWSPEYSGDENMLVDAFLKDL